MKTERQIEIINVALELISEKGIQGLTIKNLAKKIGITEPAIYRHYDSKTDILIAVLDLFKQNTELLYEKQLNSTYTSGRNFIRRISKANEFKPKQNCFGNSSTGKKNK